MPQPSLWLIAGPNGSGKTTCVRSSLVGKLLAGARFFNPDDRTLESLRADGFEGFADAPLHVQQRHFVNSANEIFAEIASAITRNERVGVETVLSTDKYLPLVEKVRAAEGFFGLVYIAVSSVTICQQRIAARVKQGGHNVPTEKLAHRWHRSISNLIRYALLADKFWVIDNSDSNPENAPLTVAYGENGKLFYLNREAFSELHEQLNQLNG